MLQAPIAEAEAIVHRRFPVPRLVDCDQNGSQARAPHGIYLVHLIIYLALNSL